MTTKTDEQERADFEAWATSQWLVLQRTVHGEDYQDLRTQVAWEAYQAGRAAQQSQDREDGERHRWLRSAGKETERIVEDMYECALSGEDLDAAIDHARRIEGEGE